MVGSLAPGVFFPAELENEVEVLVALVGGEEAIVLACDVEVLVLGELPVGGAFFGEEIELGEGLRGEEVNLLVRSDWFAGCEGSTEDDRKRALIVRWRVGLFRPG